MLAWREIVRFFRQRNRVIGAIGQPVLFWLLFGVGLNRSFSLSAAGESTGQDFLTYYFPGSLTLILLFTSIFTTISIIEDRREGFLQAVLVSPAPRWSMVLGKVLGGATIALVQALIFLGLALTLKISLGLVTLAGLVGLMFVMALALTSLGFVLAWRMDSVQGFHAIMNLCLMPMWLLSGAFFPVPSATSGVWSQTGLHWAMRLNPVTYGVAGIRHLLMGEMPLGATHAADFWLPDLATCVCVTLVFGALTFAAAARMALRPAKGDLQ